MPAVACAPLWAGRHLDACNPPAVRGKPRCRLSGAPGAKSVERMECRDFWEIKMKPLDILSASATLYPFKLVVGLANNSCRTTHLESRFDRATVICGCSLRVIRGAATEAGIRASAAKSGTGIFYALNRVTAGNRVRRTTREGMARSVVTRTAPLNRPLPVALIASAAGCNSGQRDQASVGLKTIARGCSKSEATDRQGWTLKQTTSENKSGVVYAHSLPPGLVIERN